MRLSAFLQVSPPDSGTFASLVPADSNRRKAPRRSLTLSASSKSPHGHDIPVLIRDISPGGLLLESGPGALAVDERVDLALPERPSVRARVAWTSGSFFGCEFSETISAGALSAALLKSDPRSLNDTDLPVDAVDRQAGAHRRFMPELNFTAAFLLSALLWAVISLIAFLVLR